MGILNRYIFGQIDFETLGILFSLMLVVAGFTKLGYIDILAEKMINKAKNRRMLMLLLVYACFFLSMLVTNDVALIIMVPFAIGVLVKSGNRDKLIFVVVIQTIAANLGSMLTPIGNPQNVYLYQFYEMNLSRFFGAVLPYALASFVLILIVVLLQKGGEEVVEISEPGKSAKSDKLSKSAKSDESDKTYGSGDNQGFVFKPVKTLVYSICLVLCVLSVLNVLEIYLTLIIVTIAVLVSDYRLIKKVDYGLLIKFVFLFVLVGNLAEIPVVNKAVGKLATGNEFICGVVFSQFLSNVPAAIMLSRFTDNGVVLLQGVNVGGLGTLIASMASMIAYEYYGKCEGADKKKYFIFFTAYNLIFLAIMLIISLILA